MVIAALFVLAIGSAVLLYKLRTNEVETAYNRFETARKLISAAAAGIIGWTFLQSGRPELILAAIVLLFLATVYVLVEKPNETLP